MEWRAATTANPAFAGMNIVSQLAWRDKGNGSPLLSWAGQQTMPPLPVFTVSAQLRRAAVYSLDNNGTSGFPGAENVIIRYMQ